MKTPQHLKKKLKTHTFFCVYFIGKRALINMYDADDDDAITFYSVISYSAARVDATAAGVIVCKIIFFHAHAPPICHIYSLPGWLSPCVCSQYLADSPRHTYKRSSLLHFLRSSWKSSNFSASRIFSLPGHLIPRTIFHLEKVYLETILQTFLHLFSWCWLRRYNF